MSRRRCRSRRGRTRRSATARSRWSRRPRRRSRRSTRRGSSLTAKVAVLRGRVCKGCARGYSQGEREMDVRVGEAELSLGNKLKKLAGESPSDVNMIDLEAKGTLKGAWCRDTQHTRKRRPKDSYASVPLDAVSRVKFRVKSELGRVRAQGRPGGRGGSPGGSGGGRRRAKKRTETAKARGRERRIFIANRHHLLYTISVGCLWDILDVRSREAIGENTERSRRRRSRRRCCPSPLHPG